jgi:hypothetical protein
MVEVNLGLNMLMFTTLRWLIMLQIISCGVMVKDLNLQSEVRGSNPHTCNLGLLKFFA